MRIAAARLAIALAGRRLLAPLTFLAFVLLGVYAYRENGVQGSFAVTALLAALFSAWLVSATEREVGDGADAILTAAAGGAPAAWRGRLVLVAGFTLAITVASLLWPTATGAFDRTPGLGDLGAAALAHAACGVLGGCLALLLAPPARAASAFAATIGVVLCSIAIAGPLGPLAGPGAVADALASAPDDHVTGALVVAAAVTLVQAALLAHGSRRLARRRG